MKLNVIGSIFGSSGYDSHTRQLANALHEQGEDVRLDVPRPNGWQRQVTDAELSMLNKPFDEECTSIMISTPPNWRFGLADNPKKFIGFLIWEGDKIPEYWLEYLCDERVDQIWVPSQHVKDAIFNTWYECEVPYLEGRVKIIPHGVDLSLFQPKENKEKRPFTFVVNKGWRGGMEDRGGVQYALKAFNEEFTKKDNVRMIVKLNPAYLSPNFDIKQELINIGVDLDDKPEILFSTSEVLYQGLPDFYAQGDVFVNATRCEGFGLTGLEAQACGLPTIQTSYGGQLDYMTEETDLYVPYILEEVKGDVMYEGIKWATPDIKYLRKLMRISYTNRDKIKDYKDKLAKHVNEWTWRGSSKKAVEALREIDNV